MAILIKLYQLKITIIIKTFGEVGISGGCMHIFSILVSRYSVTFLREISE